MIKLYIASKKLSVAEKDIRVRVILPTGENDIWLALQKTEMESIDDYEISDVECEIEEVDTFLKELFVYDANIFELNTFARMLTDMTEEERKAYGRKLKDAGKISLTKAIYVL